ncbi:ATP-binding cassette protein subfamily C member 5 putative (ABCC5), partial [Leptomonas seymouri]
MPIALRWYISFLKAHKNSEQSADTAITTTAPSFTVADPSYNNFRNGALHAAAAVEGFWSVALLFTLSLMHSLMLHKYGQLVARCAYAARSALSACIAEKCLRIGAKELTRPDLNVGRIFNLVASDARTVESFFKALWIAVTVPLQLCATLYLLYRSMGAATYICVAMMAFLLPLEVVVTKSMYRLQHEILKTTDARLRSTNELLSGIRSVKLMSLEGVFESEINARRTAEMTALRKYQLLYTANMLLTKSIPNCTTAFVIIAYAATGQPMSPSVIYPAIALLGLLTKPFRLLASYITIFTQFFVSMRRLSSF